MHHSVVVPIPSLGTAIRGRRFRRTGCHLAGVAGTRRQPSSAVIVCEGTMLLQLFWNARERRLRVLWRLAGQLLVFGALMVVLVILIGVGIWTDVRAIGVTVPACRPTRPR